jgi:hypothetical protein
MNRNLSVRLGTTGVAIAVLMCVARPLVAQRLRADSLAIEIAATLSDTAVVSPITGSRIPVDAMSLAAQAIKGSTLEAQTRLARALSASGTKNTLITKLLVSLSRIGAEPSYFRVQEAEQDFNEFVNAASPTFLVNPPNEFLALHAVLVRISAFATGVRT